MSSNIRFIPLLSGKAWNTFVAMDPAHIIDYEKLKDAVFKRHKINRDAYRLSLDTPADECHQELYTRLKDLLFKATAHPQKKKS